MRRLVGKEILIYVAVDLKRATQLIIGDYLIVVMHLKIALW